MDDTLHLGGHTGHRPKRACVEDGVHDGRVEVRDGDPVAGRLAAVARGGADDVTHFQPAAVKEQRRNAGPVVAPRLGIDLGCAAHLAAANEQNLIPQSARLDVFDECAYGVVKWPANVAHALDHRGVVLIGVHVPDEVGGDGDEAGAALGQPPREQHQLAEAVYVLNVARSVVPLFADAIDVHQLRSVVALDQLGILF